MISVGIDVSKEKSTVCILKPYGEVVSRPFEVCHVEKELSAPYQFPFLQMGLFLLVLFGMEVVLSVWMVRRQKKQSLVEQMRAQS